MMRHGMVTVLLGWALVTAGFAAEQPAPGKNVLKWADSLKLPEVTVQEKVFPAATKRANFTFFDGVKDVRVEDGVLKFTLAADKAVLGWGNFMGRQPLAEIQDMCDEINEVTLRVRQTGASSTWSKQTWVNGTRMDPYTLDTKPLAGTEWTELKFASSSQHGGATVPTPDGLEFAIQGTAGNQVEIEWLKLTEMIRAGYVRKEFTLPGGPVWRAVAEVGACPEDRWFWSNKMEHRLYINGKEVKRRGVSWSGSAPVDIAAYLKPGKNCVGFYGYWRGDPMVFFQTQIVMRSGDVIAVQTDKTWKYSAEAATGWNQTGFDDGKWSAAQPYLSPSGDPSVMSDEGLVWLKNPDGRDFFYRDDADARVEVRLPAGLKAKAPGVEYVFSKADADGRLQPMASDRVTNFAEKDGSLVYTVNLGKQVRGVYTIAAVVRGADGVIGERTPEPVMVVRKLHQKQIEGKDWFEGLDVELEDTIDFTNPADPHPWIEAARPAKWADPAIAVKAPTVVTANGLTYREAPWYFSYRFQFKQPGSFYLLEMEYPDDARRIIDVGVATKYEEMWSNDQSGVGAETGGRYALTGKMQTLRWIHVADAGPHSIDVLSALPGMTAAAKSLKIYRIKGDLPAVPAGSDRVFGIHSERCADGSGIGMNFGVGQNKTQAQQAAEAKMYSGLELRVRYLQFLQDATERYTQYLKFAGQNTHIMGVYQYTDGNTPFRHPFEYDTARIIPSMKSVLANTLDVNDITFYVGIEWSQFIRLATVANNAQMTRGADTIWMVDAEGKQYYGFPPYFTTVPNWMHPRNRELFTDLIVELGDKFGHLSHFAGFHNTLGLDQRESYYPPALTLPNELANPYLYSYDDSTFRQFEQETGIRLGIQATDPQRFAKRAAVIRDPRMQSRYRDWRGEKLEQFLSGGFTALRRDHGNLQFLNMLEPDLKFYKFALSSGRGFTDLLKDYALDIDRLNRVKGMGVGLQTLSFEIWGESFAQNPYAWLPKVDPYFVSAYDHGDIRYVLARTSWDENAIATVGYASARGPSKRVESDWIMDYTRTRTLPKPAGVHCREALMQAIVAADVNVLMSGFTDLNINVGFEQEIRELMTVFTHLPREKFATVLNTGFETNLAIRKLTKAGKTYFYAANPGYWSIQGNIVLTAGAPVLDLVTGKPVAVEKRDGKMILPVALKGYEMAAWRVDSPVLTIESFATTGTIAPEEQAHMDRIIARVDVLINDPEIKLALAPEDRAFAAGIVRTAREALQAREYARAWVAVTNTRFWALWQDFLEKAAKGLALLPPEIGKDPVRKDRSELRVMNADPAGGAIRIDGRLDEPGWSREKFQTGFVDKDGNPGLAETGVKVLYDNEALYLGIICADKNIPALKASNTFSWSDDAVAIFLQPDETAPVYYQLGFNTKGVQFHQKVTGGDRDNSVLPGWKVVAASDGKYWTAEVMLPYATFGMKDKGTGRWRLNVHRVFRDRLIEPGSWAFAADAWHDIKRLGRLQFL